MVIGLGVMSKKRSTNGKKPIKRGSRVAFTIGGRTVTGVVIDDHGPLGPNGGRIFRVRAVLDAFIEPFECDALEEHLTPVYAKAG